MSAIHFTADSMLFLRAAEHLLEEKENTEQVREVCQKFVRWAECLKWCATPLPDNLSVPEGLSDSLTEIHFVREVWSSDPSELGAMEETLRTWERQVCSGDAPKAPKEAADFLVRLGKRYQRQHRYQMRLEVAGDD